MIEQQPKPDWSPLPRKGLRGVQVRVLLSKKHLETSIGDQLMEIEADETVRWPSGQVHCLWTDGSTMETIMVKPHAD